MPDSTNDNHREAPAQAASEPDAHGQAAFLLLESLIHYLVDSSVISNAAAIAVVQVALEVKAEIADDLGDTPETLRRSLGLLRRLEGSLQSDAVD